MTSSSMTRSRPALRTNQPSPEFVGSCDRDTQTHTEHEQALHNTPEPLVPHAALLSVQDIGTVGSNKSSAAGVDSPCITRYKTVRESEELQKKETPHTLWPCQQQCPPRAAPAAAPHALGYPTTLEGLRSTLGRGDIHGVTVAAGHSVAKSNFPHHERNSAVRCVFQSASGVTQELAATPCAPWPSPSTCTSTPALFFHLTCIITLHEPWVCAGCCVLWAPAAMDVLTSFLPDSLPDPIKTLIAVLLLLHMLALISTPNAPGFLCSAFLCMLAPPASSFPFEPTHGVLTSNVAGTGC